jgi:hypothetical protein
MRFVWHIHSPHKKAPIFGGDTYDASPILAAVTAFVKEMTRTGAKSSMENEGELAVHPQGKAAHDIIASGGEL